MITFTPYFNKIKKMLFDRSIPVEFRAMFISNKGMAQNLRRNYNYSMYHDSEYKVDSNGYPTIHWRDTLGYQIRNVSVKNIESLLDFDVNHPEISRLDLITLLILFGRGTAIIKKILTIDSDIPERDTILEMLESAKKLKDIRKSIETPRWWEM